MSFLGEKMAALVGIDPKDSVLQRYKSTRPDKDYEGVRFNMPVPPAPCGCNDDASCWMEITGNTASIFNASLEQVYCKKKFAQYEKMEAERIANTRKQMNTDVVCPICNAKFVAPVRLTDIPAMENIQVKQPLSRWQLMIELSRYELDHLIEWHRDQQYESANKEDYELAKDHKRRLHDLELILKKQK